VWWVLFGGLTSTSVDLCADLLELASNVGGVAVKNWGIAVSDLAWVVHDDDLSNEHGSVLARVVLGVRSDVATLDVFDGQVLHVEADVVTGGGLLDLLVMHLDGLDFSGGSDGTEVTTIPALMTPVSTRPTGTVPIPPIL